MKSQLLRVGLLKVVPKRFDLRGNLELLKQCVAQAGQAGVQLLITSESFLDGYAVVEKSCTRSKLTRLALDLHKSPLLAEARQAARAAKLWLILGFTERRRGKNFNAAALIDARGKVVGVYHKTHLQTQDLKFSPGQSLPVFSTPWGPLGILICADRRWPEAVRALRVQGARLIAMPTYGMCHEENEWWMRTRSYENQCFVCFTHPHLSLITGPQGKVEAKLASSLPGLLVEDLDLSRARDDNHLADRRPDLYGVLSKKLSRRRRLG